jgi:hypothetical protein
MPHGKWRGHMKWKESLSILFTISFLLLLTAARCPWSPEETCDDPPTTPCNPSPSDGATDRPLSSNLSWGCGDSQCDLSVTYDVYFGTDSSPDAGELQGNTSSKSWNLPTLNYSTHYYWKIVAKDANGNTTSSIWDFYTVAAICDDPPTAPSNPSPADGATSISVSTNLSWQGGDPQCAGNDVDYKVYFGTDPTPDSGEYQGTVENKLWNPPGDLSNNTHYYWKIVAVDQINGQETTSSIWDFTTGFCQLPPTAPSNPSPADGATSISVSTNLSWQGGDPQCPGHGIDYQVYFGTDPTPDEGENQGTVENKLWNPPGDLSNNTHYYWKIIAVDQVTGQPTDSPIWDFTTGSAPCQIIVTSPNGGENWTEGTSHNITWNPSGSCSDYVEIELHREGDRCLTIDDHVYNDGSYTWDPVNQCDNNSDGYKVLVYDRDNDDGDTSNSTFTISDCDDVYMKLRVEPNGFLRQEGTYPYDVYMQAQLVDYGCPSWVGSSCMPSSPATCFVLNPFAGNPSWCKIKTPGYDGILVDGPLQGADIYVSCEFKNSDEDDRYSIITYDLMYVTKQGGSTNCLDLHEVFDATSNYTSKNLQVTVPGDSDEMSIKEIWVFFPGWCEPGAPVRMIESEIVVQALKVEEP